VAVPAAAPARGAAAAGPAAVEAPARSTFGRAIRPSQKKAEAVEEVYQEGDTILVE
jgi:hypothetical protein